jgi:hypothetical protein
MRAGSLLDACTLRPIRSAASTTGSGRARQVHRSRALEHALRVGAVREQEVHAAAVEPVGDVVRGVLAAVDRAIAEVGHQPVHVVGARAVREEVEVDARALHAVRPPGRHHRSTRARCRHARARKRPARGPPRDPSARRYAARPYVG